MRTLGSPAYIKYWRPYIGYLSGIGSSVGSELSKLQVNLIVDLGDKINKTKDLLGTGVDVIKGQVDTIFGKINTISTNISKNLEIAFQKAKEFPQTLGSSVEDTFRPIMVDVKN